MGGAPPPGWFGWGRNEAKRTTSGFALCKYSSFDETKGPNMTLYPLLGRGLPHWGSQQLRRRKPLSASLSRTGRLIVLIWLYLKWPLSSGGGGLISGGRPRRHCSQLRAPAAGILPATAALILQLFPSPKSAPFIHSSSHHPLFSIRSKRREAGIKSSLNESEYADVQQT